MAYDFTSRDGLIKTNDPVFLDMWEKICQDHKNKEDHWVREMRALGVHVITPDDGWVDRSFNQLTVPHYARLNLPAQVGDLIALGGPEKWRIVKIIEVGKPSFITNSANYFFDPKPVKQFPDKG